MEVTENPNYRSPVFQLSGNTENKDDDISTGCTINDEAEIHNLNDDCLIHIFSFLPLIDRFKLERVCKRWRIVSLKSWYTFKKFDCTKETWGIKDHSFPSKSLARIPNVEKVLYCIGFYLTHLDFSKASFPLKNFSEEVLSALIRYCRNLQYISLWHDPLRFCSWKLGDQASTDDLIYENRISQLFLNNKKLRCIELSLTTITGECLLNLPTDSIEKLIINCASYILPYYFVKAVNQLQKLHTLKYHNCKTINDEMIKAICFCAKNLKHLYLTSYKQTTADHTIYYIPKRIDFSPISQLINLETLNVANNHYIDDEILKKIGANCKQLKTVKLSFCYKISNEGLSDIVSLPKLQSLNICHLDKITDEVFTEMPNLRNLICRSNKNVKNQGLCQLIRKSHNIVLLDLRNCSYLSNELVEAAIKATKNRINNAILKMYVFGTNIHVKQITSVSPLLQIFRDILDYY